MRIQPISFFAAALLLLGSAGLQGQQHQAGLDQGDAAEGVPTLATVGSWKQCREYLPGKDEQCRIDFDMAQTADGKSPPQTHKDISVWPGRNGRAVVVLWHSSPFAACSVTTSPGPLGRDLSANVGSMLTSLGTVEVAAAALAAAPPAGGNPLNAHIAPNIPSPKSKSEADARAAIDELMNTLGQAMDGVTKAYQNIPAAKDDLKAIRVNLRYSYPSGDDAEHSMDAIGEAISRLLALPLPDAKTLPGLQTQIDAIDLKLNAFKAAYPKSPEFAQDREAKLYAYKQFVSTHQQFSGKIAYLSDMETKMGAVSDFIRNWKAQQSDPAALNPDGSLKNPDASVQILPVAVYPESKVALTVKCSDAVTGAALFDAIQFNVYFQQPPRFDLSAGVLVSTLRVRQIGAQNQPPVPTTPTPTPTQLANVYIQRSRPQFIPGAFLEYHLYNFKLRGVHDPADQPSHPPETMPTWMSENAPRHPFGYVGSFSVAGGILANPNNGSTQAEFFGGFSLGIQRFAILLGEHRGRSQNIKPNSGYYEGQPVISGTAIPTVENWANGLAFGITYRVPLR